MIVAAIPSLTALVRGWNNQETHTSSSLSRHVTQKDHLGLTNPLAEPQEVNLTYRKSVTLRAIPHCVRSYIGVHCKVNDHGLPWSCDQNAEMADREELLGHREKVCADVCAHK